MALVTKRYQWEGPSLAAVQAAIGAASGVKLGAVPFVELTYDDAVADEKAADSVMAAQGFVPYTAGSAASPAFVLFSPDASGFNVEVDNTGALAAKKVPMAAAVPQPTPGGDQAKKSQKPPKPQP